jgi:choline dehydrogenase-like flavoprotein
MESHIRPASAITDVWDMGGHRDRYGSSGDLYYPLNRTRVKAVGGTTLSWLGVVPRLHEKDFELRSRQGVGRDWPIGYDDLRPYYAEAEAELGVAGGGDNPFAPPRETETPMPAFPPSYSDTLFAEACSSLGITMHSVPQARNSEPYDGRSRCVGYSTCIPVCPSGAKYSADVHVRKAESEGVRVVDRVPVQRLEHGPDGERVEAAVYVTPDGSEHRQRARRFVVACGAVETPRLLLLSRSDQYPDGLANSSGTVGRYFMDHPIFAVKAEIDEQTNQEPIGYHTSECHQFYDDMPSPPGSMKLVFFNENPPSPVDRALHGGDASLRGDLTDLFTGDEWGDAALESMRDALPNRRVGMFMNPEPLPRAENRVTLHDSKTDPHGNPAPDVAWNLGEYERETMRRGREIIRSILDEMGAEIVSETPLSQTRPGSHPMGTTRMGTDPNASVVDPDLRSHDLENLFLVSSSVFVTGSALNPTLTIAALALRAAEHLDEEL